MYLQDFSQKYYKRQAHKMVKHTQTIRRQQLTNIECIWPFFGVDAFNP